jgi:hypothetical protein
MFIQAASGKAGMEPSEFVSIVFYRSIIAGLS